MKYPSIEQFRTVIYHVKKHFTDGNLPRITYIGTVKLHGTNAGIVFNRNGTQEYLSRNKILTQEADNAGFFNEMSKKTELIDYVNSVFKLTDVHKITLFGEWIGPGIQKGVAISQLPKKIFIVFNVRLDDNWARQLDGIMSPIMVAEYNKHNVFFIQQFPYYKVDIDFNKPELIQNDLAKLTLEIEEECPVGKAFGISGVGEGLVWKPLLDEFNHSVFWFKTKGAKHSVSKVTQLVEIDLEAFHKRDELIAAIVTEARLAQGLQEHTASGYSFEIKDVGHYIRWVFGDVIKEESDRIELSGFNVKDISKGISNVAKKYFNEATNTIHLTH